MSRLRVHMFLSRLDSEYDQVCGKILRKEPKFSLEQSYGYIRKRREVAPSRRPIVPKKGEGDRDGNPRHIVNINVFQELEYFEEQFEVPAIAKTIPIATKNDLSREINTSNGQTINHLVSDDQFSHEIETNDQDVFETHGIPSSTSTTEDLVQNDPPQDALKDLKWTTTMNEELETLRRNITWEVVDKHVVKKTIGSRWVFNKLNVDGTIDRYTARLVVKGYALDLLAETRVLDCKPMEIPV
ncbi:hypothetical protein ZIOFF_004287 [Zingiber officinale]|uniref:Reverse transcriptase Ty1/copia-type domain-containing protein n=1 Tax=Zingiber officinale TaxID=94328 RepID=A0A8J5IQM7_ZINOF|nr:hypothetical protein ZIOFF_004287 [Zingiber officinale]